MLEDRGRRVTLVDLGELAKAEGALTCCSIVFEGAAGLRAQGPGLRRQRLSESPKSMSQCDCPEERHQDVREKVAVDDLDLMVPEGALYGFIGPNGAGKTTTIRMIMSILFPDRGELSVLGHRSALEAKDRIGYLPEERGVYKKMKVGAFLTYMARLKGGRRAATCAGGCGSGSSGSVSARSRTRSARSCPRACSRRSSSSPR